MAGRKIRNSDKNKSYDAKVRDLIAKAKKFRELKKQKIAAFYTFKDDIAGAEAALKKRNFELEQDACRRDEDDDRPVPKEAFEDSAFYAGLDELVSASNCGFSPDELIAFHTKEMENLDIYILTLQTVSQDRLALTFFENMQKFDDFKGYRDEYLTKEKDFLSAQNAALLHAMRLSKGFHDRSKEERLY